MSMNVGFSPTQPTAKSLGFGRLDYGVPERPIPKTSIEKNTESSRMKFEDQVLANQQLMIGLLNKIQSNTHRPSGIDANC